jgi:acetyl esterase/lipase
MFAASAPALARTPHSRGTVLFLHPGLWLGGRLDYNAALARRFAADGWTCLAVDYPLGDLPRAYATTEAMAKRLRRRHPVIAIGESAGGTIAEWLAGREVVDGAIAVGAPADFTTWSIIQTGEPLSWLPQAIGIQEHPWRWSPARLLSRRTGSPLMIFFSESDKLVDPGQAAEMKRRGAEVRRIHGEHIRDPSWHAPARRWARQFLAAVRPRRSASR